MGGEAVRAFSVGCGAGCGCSWSDQSCSSVTHAGQVCVWALAKRQPAAWVPTLHASTNSMKPHRAHVSCNFIAGAYRNWLAGPRLFKSAQEVRGDYRFLPQRAATAFLAIARRFVGLRLAALAWPPLEAPSLERATAAGLRVSGTGSGTGASPMASCTTCHASWFGSRGRFGRESEGMGQLSHAGGFAPPDRKSKLDHYPGWGGVALPPGEMV